MSDDEHTQVELPIPSPFYRGGVKVVVFDDQNRLLVTQTQDQLWEMPGGGWEHDEEMEACVHREVQEELGVGVESVGPIEFAYRGVAVRGYIALRLVVRAKLASHNFVPGDDMTAAKFVTKDEFLELPMEIDEAPIKQYADRIWSLVEK